MAGQGIARLTTDGIFDSSFGPAGIVTLGSRPTSIAVQSDGTILIIGGSSTFGEALRLNSSGSLLNSFAIAEIESAVLASDGSFYVTGGGLNTGGTSQIIHYSSTGVRDPNFSNASANDNVQGNGLALQSDGNIVEVGFVPANLDNGIPALAISRFQGATQSPPPPPPPSGSISGTVFNDGNQDGSFDSGDTALASRTVFIDANNNSKLDSGEKTAVTNSSGLYTFTGLAAGTYVIRRSDTPGGYTYSEPSGGAWTVSLAAGQTVTGKDIGVFLDSGGGTTGSISGTVFNDANQDGVFDSGDTALSERVIYIDANNNGKLDSGEKTADANASGVYTFTGLAAGTYIIRRSDTPAGYTYSEPVSGFYSITLAAGQTVTGKDIGVFLSNGSENPQCRDRRHRFQ